MMTRLPLWATALMNNARKASQRRGVEFGLSRDDMAALVDRAKGCCEVSGLPFVQAFGKQPGIGSERDVGRRPWAASLDRIDNAKGYTLDNCRLVCCVTNLAMNEWGEDVLRRLAYAIASQQSSCEILAEFLQRRRRLAQEADPA